MVYSASAFTFNSAIHIFFYNAGLCDNTFKHVLKVPFEYAIDSELAQIKCIVLEATLNIFDRILEEMVHFVDFITNFKV